MLGSGFVCGLLHGAVIDTNSAAVVSAFQAGATVVNFENISGRTPQTITSYNDGGSGFGNLFRLQ